MTVSGGEQRRELPRQRGSLLIVGGSLQLPTDCLQEADRVDYFKESEALAKLLALGHVARHQVEQIGVAADDLFRTGGHRKIDIWFIFGVTRVAEDGWHRVDEYRFTLHHLYQSSDALQGQQWVAAL